MNLSRWPQWLSALLIGCVVNHFGDRLTGVNMELFLGIKTFSIPWVLDVFLVTFIAGLVTGAMYGPGGKWAGYFPPLIVHSINYWVVSGWDVMPAGAKLIPLGWWGFFVILAMEAAGFGAIIGEAMIKKNYGRRPRHLVYKDRAADKDSGQSE